MSIETENSAYGERSAASTMISQEERQAWRENHFRAPLAPDSDGTGFCFFCGIPWPCETVRLLGALDAAERPAPPADKREKCGRCGLSPGAAAHVRGCANFHEFVPPVPPAERDADAAFEAAWKPWIEGREQVRYRPSMRDAGRAMWDAAAKEARRKLGRFAVTHFREAVAALEWALGCLPEPQPPLTPESQYARELRAAREVLRRIEEALRSECADTRSRRPGPTP